MAENLSYNPYRDMHNDVQLSAMFFGKNIQNIPIFNPTQTIEVKRLYYSLERFTFTGKTCSPLLHYHFVNHTNSCGNAIANSQGLLHAETGFSYFGARYYDSDILIGWLSVDPMADKYPSLSPYAYSNWNPIKLIDPDGNSPISVLAKMMLKRTAKEGAQIYAKKQIENRLKKYMTKDIAKQFAKDLDDILTIFDGNGWEMLLEAVPIVGDIYGGTKFTKDIVKAYERLQDLENKYVEKIYKSLPK